MTTLLPVNSPHFERLARLADGFAIAVVVSLPWSTSATSILVVLWLIALIPTLDREDLRDVIKTPAGALPVALVVLAALGMLWADVTWAERWNGFTPFTKLLVLPLLFAQFRRSDRAIGVFVGFLASCVALLAASVISIFWADLYTWGLAKAPGIVVKDYVSQSGAFIVCAFVLLYLSLEAYRSRRFAAAASCVLLVVALLADVFFVAASRTTLLALPLLLLIFAFRQFRWKAMIGVIACGVVVAGAVWMSSSYVRNRVSSIIEDIELYRSKDAITSGGLRLAFWTKSVMIISDAPALGHGTGSVRATFASRAMAGEGASSVISTNPHNQILMVAIQLGSVGAVLLLLIWLAHIGLFWHPGLASWVGLVVVVQNVFGSLFNSHLFDFTQGWLYVFGVGVAGGMLFRQTRPVPAMPLSPAKASVQS